MISRGLEIALLVPAFAALLSAAATAAWLWHVPPWLADGAFLLLGLTRNGSGLASDKRTPRTPRNGFDSLSIVKPGIGLSAPASRVARSAA